jgi:hypothetical protein
MPCRNTTGTPASMTPASERAWDSAACKYNQKDLDWCRLVAICRLSGQCKGAEPIEKQAVVLEGTRSSGGNSAGLQYMKAFVAAPRQSGATICSHQQ